MLCGLASVDAVAAKREVDTSFLCLKFIDSDADWERGSHESGVGIFCNFHVNRMVSIILWPLRFGFAAVVGVR